MACKGVGGGGGWVRRRLARMRRLAPQESARGRPGMVPGSARQALERLKLRFFRQGKILVNHTSAGGRRAKGKSAEQMLRFAKAQHLFERCGQLPWRAHLGTPCFVRV